MGLCDIRVGLSGQEAAGAEPCGRASRPYQSGCAAAKLAAARARQHWLKSTPAIVRFITDVIAPSVRFMIKAADQGIEEAIAHLT
jgi:hypothetical protein